MGTLENNYISQENERRLFVRQYDRDITAFISKWARSGKTDTNFQTQAIRLLNAALNSSPSKNWSGSTTSQLTDLITNQGSKDTINLDLRDACLHFAQLWYLTKDFTALDKACALLFTFADKIPSWPIWNPFSEPDYSNRTADDPNVKASYQSEYSSGIWGNWIFFDLVLATPLLEAWAIIRDSPDCWLDPYSMKTLFDRFKLVLQWRSEATTPYNFNGQPDYSNQDHFVIRGKIDFGLLMSDAEYLHEGIRHLRNLYKVNFFSDGWWNEGAIAYHGDLQAGIKWLADDFPATYTDPQYFGNSFNGARFDGMSLPALVSSNLNRANSVIAYRYPNNYNIATGDSIYNSPATVNQRFENPKLPVRETPAPSKLFTGAGLGTLCLGGTGNETMVTLHWGAYNTHQHFDSLNLNVWSKGQEVISETYYRSLGNSTREWSASTPGHVTVTVNKKNQTQTGAFADNRRTPSSSPLDVIPNIPNWGLRWLASAGTDYGRLRLFNTEFDGVKVMEADGASAYSAVVSDITKYRRTVALVKIDDNDCYIADIFRIKGGTSYDYHLHGCLHQQSTVAVTTSPEMTTAIGKIYPAGTPADGLNLLDKVKGSTTDSGWSAVFTPNLVNENWQLHSYVVGATGTNVIEATAPAMRINSNAPFVCARRDSSESVYIAVHHPINKTGSSKITSIASLTGSSTDVVAFKVQLTNGRTDIILSGESLTSSSYVDGRINFVGSFGHLTETASPTDENQWLYLVDGSTLNVGTKSITGSVSLTGSVNIITRVEAGQTANTFVTTNPLPTGSSLNNYTLLVDPTGLPRWGYKIDSVSITDSNYSIITSDEPGLKIETDATGQYTKQEYFPNWGSYGTVSFKIPSSARLVRTSSGIWDFVGAGSATGATV